MIKIKENLKLRINYNNLISSSSSQIKQQILFCKLDSFNIYRGFHSSDCMLSDKELEKRINNLSVSESINIKSNINKDISLTSEQAEEMKLSLEKLKNEISNNKVPAGEVYDELKKVSDYINSNENTISSFEEAFPNYVKEKIINSAPSGASEAGDNSSSPVSEDSVFDIVKEISKFFDNCKSKGVSTQNCFEQLKLSSIIEKVKSNSDSETDDLKQKVGDQIMQDLSILEKIGQITLSEVYNKAKEVKDKYNITISPNYTEIGLSLVSYGLLMKAYNKHVYSKPLPKGVAAEELRILTTTKSFSRY